MTLKSYDESDWQDITIPHDWSSYLTLNKDSAAGSDGGYIDGGDGYYRVKFTSSNFMARQNVTLYFDGIYQECYVYLNGTQISENHSWFSPFSVDLTGKVLPGTNQLFIHVINKQPSCRWYSGSGIVRPVYLIASKKESTIITDQVITTKNNSEIDIKCNITNNTGADVTGKFTWNIYESDGTTLVKSAVSDELTFTAGSTDEYGGAYNAGEDVLHLWSPDDPYLYYSELALTVGDKTVTYPKIPFGVRNYEFTVDEGLIFNGQQMKMKGVCLHQDCGFFGDEEREDFLRYRLQMLKDMGCNAIRTTHNPASRLFLNLCAEMGFLVVEEFFDAWTVAKKTYDFARYFTDEYTKVINETIKRDINNPAIIMWSVGNEINRVSNYDAATVEPIITGLVDAVKALDTTRPVTMGEDRPNLESSKVCMEKVDVVGINYNSDNLSVPHTMGKPCYGSETTSAVSTWCCYTHNTGNKVCSSYDDDKVNWGSYAGAALKAHMESEYSAGMFVWTGFDYWGEPTPYNDKSYFPANGSYFGIITPSNMPKDIYYMYQSQWTSKPMIHIAPMDWTEWTEGDSIKVIVYSNCVNIKLFQNDVELETPTMNDLYQYVYNVTFAKGKLVAKGYDTEGNEVVSDEVVSAGDLAGVLIEKQRFGDYLQLNVYCADVNNNWNPHIWSSCKIDINNQKNFICAGVLINSNNVNYQRRIELLNYSILQYPLFEGCISFILKKKVTEEIDSLLLKFYINDMVWEGTIDPR